jgi:hypothetical protein
LILTCMLRNQLRSESVYGGNTKHIRQASIADAIPHSHDIDTDHLCDATVSVSCHDNRHPSGIHIVQGGSPREHMCKFIDDSKDVSISDSSHAIDCF